jgi:hypothetical protein
MPAKTPFRDQQSPAGGHSVRRRLRRGADRRHYELRACVCSDQQCTWSLIHRSEAAIMNGAEQSHLPGKSQQAGKAGLQGVFANTNRESAPWIEIPAVRYSLTRLPCACRRSTESQAGRWAALPGLRTQELLPAAACQKGKRVAARPPVAGMTGYCRRLKSEHLFRCRSGRHISLSICRT